MNVLIVEDDPDIGSVLSRGLGGEGFDVTVVDTAAGALATAKEMNPCAILLDMILPDGSGLDICRSLRESGHTGPIIFLSAKDEVSDRADGLTAGADDYIVKPSSSTSWWRGCAPICCIGPAARRKKRELVAGRLVLDLETRQAHFGTVHIRLTQREAELLGLLMQSANHPVSRGDIFDRLWATQGGVSLNVVDVYVGYLRGKFADITRVGGPSIGTVRGREFMLDMAGNGALSRQAT